MTKEYSAKLTGYFNALLSGHDLGHDSSSAVAEVPKTGDSENAKNQGENTPKAL